MLGKEIHRQNLLYLKNSWKLIFKSQAEQAQTSVQGHHLPRRHLLAPEGTKRARWRPQATEERQESEHVQWGKDYTWHGVVRVPIFCIKTELIYNANTKNVIN